jgi:hypothetical protein
MSSRSRAVPLIVTTAEAVATIVSSSDFCEADGLLSTVCSTTMLGTVSRRSSGTISAPSRPG